MKDRPKRADIGRVDAAAERIVGDQNIAVAQGLGRMVLQYSLQHAAQSRDMHLAEFRLGNHPARPVEQRAGDLGRGADEG